MDEQWKDATEEENTFRWRNFRFEDYISFILFWLIIVVVSLQVISRYLFQSSMTWTEEISRYLLIIMTFIGSSLAVRLHSHVYIDFFRQLLPRWLSVSVKLAAYLLNILFYMVCLWLSWPMFQFMRERKMVMMDLSMGIVYGGVMIGFLLMTYRSISVFVHEIKKMKTGKGV